METAGLAGFSIIPDQRSFLYMAQDFITQKPDNRFLTPLVDYYFFIDTAVEALDPSQEYVIPFPRITFGYFFDHPFLVTNHDLNASATVDMVISRISPHKITVKPQTGRIKIIGAHVRPYALAYLTEKPIGDLPWLIDTIDLFGQKAVAFKQKIKRCGRPKQMFSEVENIFLETLLVRDLSRITRAVEIIDEHAGNIRLKSVAGQVGISERALREQFHKYIGCAPKVYMQLVKLKRSVYLMRYSDSNLTGITYDSHYFDQAHFINTVRDITGKSPKTLRKEMLNFRFLQF